MRGRIRGERERERETRSIVGDKAKCGPCDSENWNVRTGAKPRHVSIRSQPGFPLNPAAFNRPTRLNFHRRWLRHLRLESVLNNYFYLPPTMTYRRGTRFPPPLLATPVKFCRIKKLVISNETQELYFLNDVNSFDSFDRAADSKITLRIHRDVLETGPRILNSHLTSRTLP